MPYPEITQRNDATTVARQQTYEPIKAPWYYQTRDKQYRSGLTGEISRLIDHVTHNDTEGVDIRDQGELKQGNSRLAMELDDRLQHNNNPFGLAYNTLLPIVATAGMVYAPAAAAKGMLQGVAANDITNKITGTPLAQSLSPYIGQELSQTLMFNPVRKTGVNASTVLNAASKQGGTKLVRKYAPASEPPVYTAETAPKTVRLNDKDITVMHVNDGEPNAIKLSGKPLMEYADDTFNKADHGTAVRLGIALDEPQWGLSADSAPLYFHKTYDWAKAGKGGFFIPEGEPKYVKLNKSSQWEPKADGSVSPPFSTPSPYRDNLIANLNKRIGKINGLGYNFPESRVFNVKHGDYTVEHVFIPNIGFLKYKNGGKSNVYR